MSLKEKTLFGTRDKVAIAIARLKEFEPEEGYYLAFSGGKDSVTIKALADMSGVKYDAHYSVTTIDPPELVRFIIEKHPDVERCHPEMPLISYMAKRKLWPPMRYQRWCCELYKEAGGTGRRVVTGVRWAESSKRNKRRVVEQCFRDKSQTFVNPIIDWTDKDVWAFIRGTKIPYCSLYDEGFERLGCVGCPMVTQEKRERELERWPNYKRWWLRGFASMMVEREKVGKPCRNWKTAEEWFAWWLSGGTQRKEDPDQKVMFE